MNRAEVDKQIADEHVAALKKRLPGEPREGFVPSDVREKQRLLGATFAKVRADERDRVKASIAARLRAVKPTDPLTGRITVGMATSAVDQEDGK